MRKLWVLVLSLALLPTLAVAKAKHKKPKPMPKFVVQDWERIAPSALDLAVCESAKSPFYITGDFDGDGTADTAAIAKNAQGYALIEVPARGKKRVWVLQTLSSGAPGGVLITLEKKGKVVAEKGKATRHKLKFYSIRLEICGQSATLYTWDKKAKAFSSFAPND